MPQFRGPNDIGSLKEWLRRIANNLCYKELKRRHIESPEEKENFLEQRVADMPLRHRHQAYRSYPSSHEIGKATSLLRISHSR
jgi:DNA-directed RNA polymerase specialized sigma24 family protein